jgi:hypothetical protein
MNWLKRLLGKDERFFDLLEAGADEAKASVDIFGRYLDSLARAPPRRTWRNWSTPAARKSASARK